MSPAYYELQGLLGAGGMGSVHAAVHVPTGRELAIKIPHSSDDDAVKRALLREVATASRLRHPNIVSLLDMVRLDDGRLALVMERVEGENLAFWAAEWPGWGPLLGVLEDVGAALVAAHAAGIVHRDLKPENVLVTRDGRAKITDFGIAVDLDLRSSEQDSAVAGTPLYMAPEQFSTGGHIGPWTDVYAFGVLLHVLVTGEAPYEQTSLARLYVGKRMGDLSGALAHARVPAELASLIRGLLEPDPRARPRFMREVATYLASLPLTDQPSPRVPLAEPVIARSAPHPAADAVTTPAPSARGAAVATAPTQPSSPENAALLPPTRLPAPRDPALGVTVARLRDPELVARERERELIWRAMGEVVGGAGSRLIALVGPFGVGKSALARWGLAAAESSGSMEPLATAYGAQGGGGSVGLTGAIARLVGSPEPEGAEARLRWLARGGHLDFDAQRLARWLAGDVELAGRREAAELAHAVLRAASRVRPVYLWLDDLGWSEDGAIELAERLLADRDAAVLVVATFRGGTLEHPRVHDAIARILAHPNAVRCDVEALDAAERVELIRALAPVELEAARAIAAELDDPTLVTVELVHDWISSGLLVESDSGYRAARSVAELLVERPPSRALERRVEAVIAAFGARAAMAEHVLVRAALIGVVFDESALAAVCADIDSTGDAVRDVLDRSLLTGLLRPEGKRAYRFEHDVMRAALEARLDAAAGATVRTETGRALARHFGSSRPELVAHAAELIHQGDPSGREAWQVLVDSAITLARNSGFSATQEQIERAQRWLEEDRVPARDVRRVLTHFGRGFAAFFQSRYDEARADLDVAESTARDLGEAKIVQRVVNVRVQMLLYEDRLADAERLAHAVLDEPEGEQPASLRTRGTQHHVLAEISALRDDHEAALFHAQQSVAHFQELQEPVLVRIARSELVERLMLLGRFDEAEQTLREIEADVEAAGDTGSLADVLQTRYRLLVATSEWRRLRDLGLRKRAEEVEKEGDAWRLTSLRVLEALVSLHLDDDAAAIAAAERFIQAFRRAHHDEALTRVEMSDLALGLERRGLFELANEVRNLLAERTAAIRRSFG